MSERENERARESERTRENVRMNERERENRNEREWEKEILIGWSKRVYIKKHSGGRYGETG